MNSTQTDAAADVAAARRAATELIRAADSLRRHFGDTVDVRRLVHDAERISADLDLLVGPEAKVPGQQPSEVLVPDTPYPPEMWDPSEDEGIGRH